MQMLMIDQWLFEPNLMDGGIFLEEGITRLIMMQILYPCA